jgi:predicted nucleic acid-binding protein
MTSPHPGARIFVDTSAFFALADPRDESHAASLRIRSELIERQSALWTTNLILAEAHALFLRRLGRQPALLFIDSIDGSDVTVVRVSPADEQRAREVIRNYADKDFSLTDAVSFAVMGRLRIPQAFAFNRNFRQFGVAVLA